MRSLLSNAPPEFVAARKAAVDELKRSGHRDSAALVGALRRPTWRDWALNRAAAAEPALARRFADAAHAMRSAQAAAIAGAGADVSGALRLLREASSALVRAAGSELRRADRPADAAGLTERLTEIAADAESTEAMLAGVLVEAGAGSASSGSNPTAGASPEAPTRERPGQGDRTDRAAQTAARRRIERALGELDARRRSVDRELQVSEAALREADAAHALAADALERALAGLAAAEERVAGARAHHDDAVKRLAELELETERHQREPGAPDPSRTSEPEAPVQARTRRRTGP